MGLGENLRKAIEKIRNSSVLDKETVKAAVKELQRALISGDVDVKLVLEISKKIEDSAFQDLPKGINRREHVIKTTYDLLAEKLGGEAKAPEKPERILLVGLFGSGKTTTAAKIAKYYSARGMKVGLIGADAFRPAAYEQLKQLADKVKIDFYGDKKEKNAARIVEAGMKEFKGKDLVIVDSAGRSALDSELKKEVVVIGKALNPDNTWLVLGADIGQLAKKQAKAFHDSVGVNGVILTRMDGSAKGGGALVACNETGSPVIFIGTGEKPADLEVFDAQRFLSRIMGYGDLQGLLEKIKEIEAEEMNAEAFMEGEFNLKIFYNQLKAARKMGPLDKVMDMAGLGQQVPKEMMELGEGKLDGFKVIMESMTDKEKENPELLNKNRIQRIAKGSGKKESDVRELLKQYKVMEKMAKKMAKIDLEKMQKKGGMNLEKLMKGFGRKKKMKIR
ncbi:MAG: signal recognition particle receptor subunit alpha [Candidatus Diapherotrites archaeon]